MFDECMSENNFIGANAIARDLIDAGFEKEGMQLSQDVLDAKRKFVNTPAGVIATQMEVIKNNLK
jgi:hypothetical protein